MKDSTLKKDKKLMIAACVSFVLSSSAVLIAPFGDFEGSMFNVAVAYAIGIIFWLFLIIGYVIILRINFHRKAQKKIKVSGRPGIISVFSNKPAMVFDIIFAVSVIMFIIFKFVIQKYDLVSLFLLASSLFSFHMHGVLNGVNHKYVNYKESGESEE